MRIRNLFLAAAATLSLFVGAAQAQQVGAYGIVTSGTPTGTPSQGDVNISGAYKVNGVAVAGGGNCSSGVSPAVCAAASSGSVAVPTGTNPTLVVNTTAVTASSQIFLTTDESLGTKLGVTCNTTITTIAPVVVTARTAGTSFTVQVDATVGTNPVCLSYTIIN